MYRGGGSVRFWRGGMRFPLPVGDESILGVGFGYSITM